MLQRFFSSSVLVLTGDVVHLSDAGNKLVAEQMLKALGEELK